MAISAVTQAFSQFAQKTTGPSASSSSNAASAAAAQEANETLSTTKTEAAHGDRQAKLKLAKIQQRQELSNPQTAVEPGKGDAIDKKA